MWNRQQKLVQRTVYLTRLGVGVESQERLDGRGTKRFILERGERLYVVVRSTGLREWGEAGSREAGPGQGWCHASDLRLEPGLDRVLLKGLKQRINNSLQYSPASSLLKVLICSILGLPNTQEESLRLSSSKASRNVPQN